MATDFPLRLAIVANSVFNISNFRAALIRTLAEAGIEVTVIVPMGEPIDSLSNLPVVIERANHLRRGTLNPLRGLLLTVELLRIYQRRRVDCTLHYTVLAVIAGTIAGRLLGKPVVNTITGLGYAFINGGTSRRTAELLYGMVLPWSSFTYFHNGDDHHLFLQKGYVEPNNSGTIGGSGIELQHFLPRPLRPRPPFVFLCIARLLRDKGVVEFLAAARVLTENHPEATFILLGGLDPGNPAALLPADIEKMIDGHRIRWVDEVADVRPFITAATVVVLPSYREGLPRTLLEATATGRPLIATDVPGCRAVVHPGKNGWLVNARDTQALVDAMREALRTEAEKLGAMGRYGRALVEEKFAATLINDRYLEKIQELTRG